MEKRTRKMLAAEASDRWDRHYAPFKSVALLQISENLKALGPSPEPSEVDSVIGNGSWTRLTCSECGQDVDEVVQVGDEPDYESSTAWLCRPCLKSAAELP